MYSTPPSDSTTPKDLSQMPVKIAVDDLPSVRVVLVAILGGSLFLGLLLRLGLDVLIERSELGFLIGATVGYVTIDVSMMASWAAFSKSFHKRFDQSTIRSDNAEPQLATALHNRVGMAVTEYLNGRVLRLTTLLFFAVVPSVLAIPLFLWTDFRSSLGTVVLAYSSFASMWLILETLGYVRFGHFLLSSRLFTAFVHSDGEGDFIWVAWLAGKNDY